MDLKIMFLPCSLLFWKPIFTPPWHALICTRQKSLRWEMIVHVSSNQQHPTPSASYPTVSWDAEYIWACHFGFGTLKSPDFTKSFPLLSISANCLFQDREQLEKVLRESFMRSFETGPSLFDQWECLHGFVPIRLLCCQWVTNRERSYHMKGIKHQADSLYDFVFKDQIF